MRLGEAIRLGAMLHPQAVGEMHATRSVSLPGDVLGLRTAVEATCALGAAVLAAGVRCRETISHGGGRPYRGQATQAGEVVIAVDMPWQWNLSDVALCPVCGDGRQSEELFRLIPHLNDDHRWTREQIADFIDAREDRINAAIAKATGVAS